MIEPNPKITSLLRVGAVRRFCNARGKMLGRDFLPMLENHVRRKLDSACRVHNGGKQTLDSAIAGHIGLLS